MLTIASILPFLRCEVGHLKDADKIHDFFPLRQRRTRELGAGVVQEA